MEHIDPNMEQETQLTRDPQVAELQEALAGVTTFSGLLPICASCKRVRDDKGYWSRLEEFIVAHPVTEFSHGICPDCEGKLLDKQAGEPEPLRGLQRHMFPQTDYRGDQNDPERDLVHCCKKSPILCCARIKTATSATSPRGYYAVVAQGPEDSDVGLFASR